MNTTLHPHLPRLPAAVATAIRIHPHRDDAHVVIDYVPATAGCGARWRCYHPTGEADYPAKSVAKFFELAAGRLADLDTFSPLPDGDPHAALLTPQAQEAVLAAAGPDRAASPSWRHLVGEALRSADLTGLSSWLAAPSVDGGAA